MSYGAELRPDITVMVEWALQINLLSIYGAELRPWLTQLVEGRLHNMYCAERGIRLHTKLAVYTAVVITPLL